MRLIYAKPLLVLFTLLLLFSSRHVLADNASLSTMQASGRAVVVIEGGGSPHPFTTPWSACDGGRPQFVQALLNAGLPVFTAPGFVNQANSTANRSGCPAQPPLEVQWNTSGYPQQAGQAVLGFLGYLHETYGYSTFDLVGYSYGGLVARATIAAIKQKESTENMAPAFSYARVAVNAGVLIPTLVTINSPHLGAPSYDIASNPSKYLRDVSKSWGFQYANSAKGLIEFEDTTGAGAIHVLTTSGHSKSNPNGWDEKQVGVLDGTKITLIAGDSCGRVCGAGLFGGVNTLRTDGTVPVYSQLLLPCNSPCRIPPGSVYIPPGMVPETGVIRKIFPTVHSTYDADLLRLPQYISVSKNPEAINYIVTTVLSYWREDGVSPPLISAP